MGNIVWWSWMRFTVVLRGVLWPLTKRITTPNSLQSWPCVRKATHLPRGHFFDCWSPHRHLLYFEVWGNKMDPASKVWFLLKSFPVRTSATGRDKCHLLPRKFGVKILKYFQPSFPEEACFLLCGKIDHLPTRRISILLWKRPSRLHPLAISGEEQGTLPTTRVEVRMGKDNAVSFIGVN